MPGWILIYLPPVCLSSGPLVWISLWKLPKCAQVVFYGHNSCRVLARKTQNLSLLEPIAKPPVGASRRKIFTITSRALVWRPWRPLKATPNRFTPTVLMKLSLYRLIFLLELPETPNYFYKWKAEQPMLLTLGVAVILLND